VTEGAWREEIWLTYNCPRSQFIQRACFTDMHKERGKTKATVKLHPSSAYGNSRYVPA
jgi:hypothetical protein